MTRKQKIADGFLTVASIFLMMILMQLLISFPVLFMIDQDWKLLILPFIINVVLFFLSVGVAKHIERA